MSNVFLNSFSISYLYILCVIFSSSLFITFSIFSMHLYIINNVYIYIMCMYTQYIYIYILFFHSWCILNAHKHVFFTFENKNEDIFEKYFSQLLNTTRFPPSKNNEQLFCMWLSIASNRSSFCAPSTK